MTRVEPTDRRTPAGHTPALPATRRRRRLWSVAAPVCAALLAVGLSGCGEGPARPGSAMIVGDRRISERDLQDATTAINASIGVKNGSSNGALQQNVLLWLLIGPEIRSKAESLEVFMSDKDLDQQIDVIAKQAADKDAATPPPLTGLGREALRDYLMLSSVGQRLSQDGASEEAASAAVQQWLKGLVESLLKQGVTINPRYGVFHTPDIEAAQRPGDLLDLVRPPSLNWLSTNTPTPTESPSEGPAEGPTESPAP